MKSTEPVVLNGTAASIAAAATPALIAAGLNANDAGRAGSFAGAVLAFIFVVLQLASARSKVTPVARPKSAAGVPLVELPDAAASPATAATPPNTAPDVYTPPDTTEPALVVD